MDYVTPILTVILLLGVGGLAVWMGLRASGRTGPQEIVPPLVQEKIANQDRAIARSTEIHNAAQRSTLIHMQAVRLSDQVNQYEEWRRHG